LLDQRRVTGFSQLKGEGTPLRQGKEENVGKAKDRIQRTENKKERKGDAGKGRGVIKGK